MSFRIVAEIVDGAREAMAEAEAEASHRVTLITRRHVERLKLGLRDQVLSAFSSRRLANTWQSKDYPSGQDSMSPAGVVRSKAPKIIEAFDDGVTITAGRGKYLAVPTDAVPRASGRGGRAKMTPAQVEEKFGRKLRPVPRGRYVLLVMEGLTRSRNGRAWRINTSRRRSQGRQTQDVVMFVLLPQVHMRKRLDLAGAGERAADGLAADLREDLG